MKTALGILLIEGKRQILVLSTSWKIEKNMGLGGGLQGQSEVSSLGKVTHNWLHEKNWIDRYAQEVTCGGRACQEVEEAFSGSVKAGVGGYLAVAQEHQVSLKVVSTEGGVGVGGLADRRGWCEGDQSRKASLGFRLEGNSGAWRRIRWRLEHDPLVAKDR